MNSTYLTRRQFKRMYYTSTTRTWLVFALCAVILCAIIPAYIAGLMPTVKLSTVISTCFPFAAGIFVTLRVIIKKAIILHKIDRAGIIDEAIADFNRPDTIHTGKADSFTAVGSEFIFDLKNGVIIRYSNISRVQLRRNYLPNDDSDPSRHTVTLIVYLDATGHPILTESVAAPTGQFAAAVERIKQRRPDITFTA